jgi:acyl carrier protein
LQSTILETVRVAVAKVTRRDLNGVEANTPLKLDSLSRITLVLELENRFGVELDSDAMTPEVFETLESLAEFVERQQQV